MPHRRLRLASLLLCLIPWIWGASITGAEDPPVEPEPPATDPGEAAETPADVAGSEGSTPYGRVRDGDGKPVPGAEVVVVAYRGDGRGLDSRVGLATATTDDNGGFLIADLAGDVLDVRVEAEGFATAVRLAVPAGPALDLELERGRPVSGRVVDGRSGEPVVGASVRIEDEAAFVFGDDFARTATSGEDGRFRFERVGGASVGLRVVAPGKAAVVRRQPVEAENEVYRLFSGSPVSGKVVDPSGAGIPDARVWIAPQGRSIGGTVDWTALERAVGTDEDGAFHFAGLPPGEYGFRARHERRPDAESVTVEVPEGRALEGVRLVLSDGAAVRFVLRGPDGTPVERIDRVVASTVPVDGAEPKSHQTRTIAEEGEGTFVANGLPEGKVRLEIVSVGALPLELDDVTLKVGETTDLGVLEVDPGKGLSGVVRDVDGDPVEEAQIHVRWFRFVERGRADRGQQTGRSGTDGRFRVNGIGDAETVRVRVSREGYAPWEREEVDPAGDPLTVVLEREARIAGEVRLEEGGIPTAFEVRVYQASGEGRTGGWPGNLRPVEERTFEGADTFEISGFGPGTWDVEVRASGRVPVTREGVEVEAGGAAKAGTFELSRGLHVAGTVVGASEAPVGGAGVRVDAGGGFMGMMAGFDREDRDTVITDADGRFRVEGLAPGKKTVRVDHADHAPAAVDVVLESGGSRDDLVVRLESGGAVAGTVRDEDGRPRVGVMVTVFDRSNPSMRSMATTGADGTYRIEKVPAGTYPVMAMDRDAGPAGMRTKNATVTAGETTIVDFDETGGVLVRGTVRRGDEPIADARTMWVSAWTGGMPEVQSAQTGSDGRFEVRLPRAGRYQVSITGPDGGSGTTVTVPDEPEVEMDVVLRTAGVAGRVVGADGEAIAGAAVQAVPDSDDAIAVSGGSAITESDGTFRIEGLDPGRYTIVAGASGYAGAEVEGVVVPESGDPAPVEIALQAGRAVRGRVVDPAGAPVAGAMTLVFPAGAEPSFGGAVDGVTDRNGRFENQQAPDGTLSVIVLTQGFAPTAVEGFVRTEDPEDDDVVVRMTVGGTLRVRVADLAGSPRAGFSGIELQPARFPQVSLFSQLFAPTGPTAADGVATYTALMPGSYTVTATGAQPVQVEVVEGGVAEVTLVVPDAP